MAWALPPWLLRLYMVVDVLDEPTMRVEDLLKPV